MVGVGDAGLRRGRRADGREGGETAGRGDSADPSGGKRSTLGFLLRRSGPRPNDGRMKPLWRTVGWMLGSSLVLPVLPAAESGGPASYHVYFGTYSKPNSRGIYRATLDAATGKLGPAEVAAEAKDPAFLAVHPNGRYVYAIMESSDPAKTPGRGVMAYAVEPKTGKLTLLNEQSAGGPGPCHLEVDRTGRTVLVANYSGGSVAALPIGADGKLGPAKTVLAHAGSSVHPTRQRRPHAHAINVAPDNRFALVPDLGTDKVMVYRLDAAGGTLAPHAPAFAALPPGSGPRHLAFGPDGKFVYVINELVCTIAAFRYDATVMPTGRHLPGLRRHVRTAAGGMIVCDARLMAGPPRIPAGRPRTLSLAPLVARTPRALRDRAGDGVAACRERPMAPGQATRPAAGPATRPATRPAVGGRDGTAG